MCFRDSNDAGYIDQTKRWICGRLYPYQLRSARGQRERLKSSGDGTNLGIIAECMVHFLFINVLEIDKGYFYTLVLLGDASHVIESASIDVIDADDVGIMTQGLDDSGGGG